MALVGGCQGILGGSQGVAGLSWWVSGSCKCIVISFVQSGCQRVSRALLGGDCKCVWVVARQLLGYFQKCWHQQEVARTFWVVAKELLGCSGCCQGVASTLLEGLFSVVPREFLGHCQGVASVFWVVARELLWHCQEVAKLFGLVAGVFWVVASKLLGH